jgi:radical SAM superfamily enzyme YgiQ (UPF0313 family)
MHYIGKVYRPPSEARSLILQCTVGCAHNTCKFCSMYKDDRFFMRDQADILRDLDEAAATLPWIEKLFLADGDALVLSAARLIEIMEHAHAKLPKLRQISAYATVKDILHKSPEELRALRDAGLDLLYIGLESGSDEVLQAMGKDQTQDEFVQACHQAKAAGLRLSVTIILGIAERDKSEEHIRESARAISRAKPDYAACLSLYLEPSAPLYGEVQAGRFQMLSDDELMDEMRRFVEQVDSEGTVFRSNHPSNPHAIRGTFNEDREKMLAQIDRAICCENYRPQRFRGL